MHDQLIQTLRQFAAERDWDRFHSPKNLVMGLAGEVGELAEVFRWLSEEQSWALEKDQRARASEEIADVFIYLVMLADKLSINLVDEAYRKIKQNAKKYPVEKVRGKALKSTEYPEK